MLLQYNVRVQVMSRQPSVCPAEPLESEDFLFLLYTSGSTGKPKGIVHSQAGYLLYTSLTHEVHTHKHTRRHGNRRVRCWRCYSLVLASWSVSRTLGREIVGSSPGQNSDIISMNSKETNNHSPDSLTVPLMRSEDKGLQELHKCYTTRGLLVLRGGRGGG